MDKSMLLFALNVIKTECGSHDSCESCPFKVESIIDRCGIRKDIPIEWNLLDDEPCDEQLIF